MGDIEGIVHLKLIIHALVLNSVTAHSVNITFFTYSNVLPFFVFNLVIMCVQTCLTYQIKGEISVYLNVIVLNLLSQRQIIIFLMKLKND